MTSETGDMSRSDAGSDMDRRVARQLLDAARRARTSGEVLSPYLFRYLAEHVGSANLWTELGDDAGLVDQLDDSAVALEAFRSGYGRPGGLPAAVVTTMIARDELAAAGPAQRGLTRALAAFRAYGAEPSLADPRLRWARMTRSVPHLRLTGHRGPVESVAFGGLPDGRVLLATGGDDGTVRLWDPATGTPVGDPLTGHTGRVSSVAFGRLPDGRVLLATGSHDHTVRLWDPATGTPVGDPLTGHTAEVSCGGVRAAAGRAGAAGQRQLGPHGAAVGPGHRRPRSATRSPATPPR